MCLKLLTKTGACPLLARFLLDRAAVRCSDVSPAGYQTDQRRQDKNNQDRSLLWLDYGYVSGRGERSARLLIARVKSVCAASTAS